MLSPSPPPPIGYASPSAKLTPRANRQFGSFLMKKDKQVKREPIEEEQEQEGPPTTFTISLSPAASPHSTPRTERKIIVHFAQLPGAADDSTALDNPPTSAPPSPAHAQKIINPVNLASAVSYVRPRQADNVHRLRTRVELLPPSIQPHPLSKDARVRAAEQERIKEEYEAARAFVAAERKKLGLEPEEKSELDENGEPNPGVLDHLEATYFTPAIPQEPARPTKRSGQTAAAHRMMQLQGELMAIVQPLQQTNLLPTQETVNQMKRLSRALKESHSQGVSSTPPDIIYPPSLQALANQKTETSFEANAAPLLELLAPHVDSQAPSQASSDSRIKEAARKMRPWRYAKGFDRHHTVVQDMMAHEFHPSTSSMMLPDSHAALLLEERNNVLYNVSSYTNPKSPEDHDGRAQSNSPVRSAQLPNNTAGPNVSSSLSLSLFRAPPAIKWVNKGISVHANDFHHIRYQNPDTSRERFPPRIERADAALRTVDPEELERIEPFTPPHTFGEECHRERSLHNRSVELIHQREVARSLSPPKNAHHHQHQNHNHSRRPHTHHQSAHPEPWSSSSRSNSAADLSQQPSIPIDPILKQATEASETTPVAQPADADTTAVISPTSPLVAGAVAAPVAVQLKRQVYGKFGKFLVDDVAGGALYRAGLINLAEAHSEQFYSYPPLSPDQAALQAPPLPLPKTREQVLDYLTKVIENSLPFPTRSGSRVGLASRDRAARHAVDAPPTVDMQRSQPGGSRTRLDRSGSPTKVLSFLNHSASAQRQLSPTRNSYANAARPMTEQSALGHSSSLRNIPPSAPASPDFAYRALARYESDEGSHSSSSAGQQPQVVMSRVASKSELPDSESLQGIHAPTAAGNAGTGGASNAVRTKPLGHSPVYHDSFLSGLLEELLPDVLLWKEQQRREDRKRMKKEQKDREREKVEADARMKQIAQGVPEVVEAEKKNTDLIREVLTKMISPSKLNAFAMFGIKAENEPKAAETEAAESQEPPTAVVDNENQILMLDNAATGLTEALSPPLTSGDDTVGEMPVLPPTNVEEFVRPSTSHGRQSISAATPAAVVEVTATIDEISPSALQKAPNLHLLTAVQPDVLTIDRPEAGLDAVEAASTGQQVTSSPMKSPPLPTTTVRTSTSFSVEVGVSEEVHTIAPSAQITIGAGEESAAAYYPPLEAAAVPLPETRPQSGFVEAVVEFISGPTNESLTRPSTSGQLSIDWTPQPSGFVEPTQPISTTDTVATTTTEALIPLDVPSVAAAEAEKETSTVEPAPTLLPRALTLDLSTPSDFIPNGPLTPPPGKGSSLSPVHRTSIHRRSVSQWIAGSKHAPALPSPLAVVSVLTPTMAAAAASVAAAASGATSAAGRMAASVSSIHRRRTETNESRKAFLTLNFKGAALPADGAGPASGAGAPPSVDEKGGSTLFIDLEAAKEKIRRQEQVSKFVAAQKQAHEAYLRAQAAELEERMQHDADISDANDPSSSPHGKKLSVDASADPNQPALVSPEKAAMVLIKSPSSRQLSPKRALSSVPSIPAIPPAQQVPLPSPPAAAKQKKTNSIVTSETKSKLVQLLTPVSGYIPNAPIVPALLLPTPSSSTTPGGSLSARTASDSRNTTPSSQPASRWSGAATARAPVIRTTVSSGSAGLVRSLAAVTPALIMREEKQHESSQNEQALQANQRVVVIEPAQPVKPNRFPFKRTHVPGQSSQHAASTTATTNTPILPAIVNKTTTTPTPLAAARPSVIGTSGRAVIPSANAPVASTETALHSLVQSLLSARPRSLASLQRLYTSLETSMRALHSDASAQCMPFQLHAARANKLQHKLLQELSSMEQRTQQALKYVELYSSNATTVSAAESAEWRALFESDLDFIARTRAELLL